MAMRDDLTNTAAETLTETATEQTARTGEEVVIPIVEEMLSVDKRTVVTGGVRLVKRVTEREEVVDEPLLREAVRVERVSINQIVTEAPPARQEGDTLIVPVLEEVLVTEKRLLLKEEIRITRSQATVSDPQTITLRAEHAILEELLPETTKNIN